MKARRQALLREIVESQSIPTQEELAQALGERGMVVTLFMIGASLPVSMSKSVGVKPLVLAVLLWIIISVSSLFVVTNTVA